MQRRGSGVLLPIFSLPGDYGCGTLGREAFSFVDFLVDAGQQYWQILPLVPPGGGNSPYMSPSAFAGNPLLIDPELLLEGGLITGGELAAAALPDDAGRVRYEVLCAARSTLLRAAWARADDALRQAVSDFATANDWLDDHAFFMALKENFDGLALSDWPDEDIRARTADALAYYRAQLAGDIAFHQFLQYLFYTQWAALKEYAGARGIKLIGDLPIYVSADSVEMWAHGALFQTESDGSLSAVAGVPPDAFTDDGQLWGNPLYDWHGNADAVLEFWLRRMRHTNAQYDVVRIDHFRAFHTYWAVPRGAATARDGHWRVGPGMPFVRAITQLPNLTVIAEDLGDLDLSCLDFFVKTGLPGMKVLLYAFDENSDSAYLPHNCQKNSVFYIGTHDTPTFLQWFYDEAAPAQRQFCLDYLHTTEADLSWSAVRAAWGAPSVLAIAPFQDLLCLRGEGRMNLPGTVSPLNWSWRAARADFSPALAEKLRRLTATYRRL